MSLLGRGTGRRERPTSLWQRNRQNRALSLGPGAGQAPHSTPPGRSTAGHCSLCPSASVCDTGGQCWPPGSKQVLETSEMDSEHSSNRCRIRRLAEEIISRWLQQLPLFPWTARVSVSRYRACWGRSRDKGPRASLPFDLESNSKREGS